ncbi:MAG: hypothetical protein OEL57_02355 [Trichlorobacter sp.]|uniref:hypothetical protein n=1 Tax=Trichlorobacter sp. TaxID=2911007 RepID=UPI00256B3C08|nr:hypothetical protein [Trichlorobacter sp.]MDK9716733.1 hypothetical protein [Trichlorobacter sp.]
MDEWDLVFRAGKHTDSSGNTRNWTTDDLDKIVCSFNPEVHEPPLVIGHPADNAPAFGWVAGIKREGTGLYLKYKDVANEFKDWAAKKLFKKKSIALYPDGSLRHIGYLGAMPPAIKGLPDFAFNDGDRGTAITYEYSDWRMTTLGQIILRLRDHLVETLGAEKADNIIKGWEVQDLLTPPPEPEQSNSLYNEPEEEGMKPEEVQDLITKAVGTTAAQFAENMKTVGETIKGLSEQVGNLQKQLTTERDGRLRAEFREFLMTPEMQQRVAEGSREATINHMMTLASAAPVEFGEGDGKTTRSALDVYKGQLMALPTVVQFGEHATKDKVGDLAKVGDMDVDTLAANARQFVESEAAAGRTVSYTDAVSHIKKGGAK